MVLFIAVAFVRLAFLGEWGRGSKLSGTQSACSCLDRLEKCCPPDRGVVLFLGVGTLWIGASWRGFRS